MYDKNNVLIARIARRRMNDGYVDLRTTLVFVGRG
jgi:hypothetical protein